MVKKIGGLVISVLLSLAFLSLLSACTPSLEFGSLTICSAIDNDTGSPLDERETFSIEDDSLYATIEASGVKADQNYRYTVIDQISDSIIYDETMNYSDVETGYVEGYFYLEHEGEGGKLLIQPGQYRVDFYHQGELIDSASFEIKAPEVEIIEILLARSINEETMAPIETASSFNPDDDIYATVKLNNSLAGDYFDAKWYYGQNIIAEKTIDIENNYFEESYVAFSLTSEEWWQPGEYSVQINHNGASIGTYDFGVIAPIEEQATETFLFSEGLIYTSEEYKFQFAVPDGWEVKESEDNKELGLELSSEKENIPVAFVILASNPASAISEAEYKKQSDELASIAAADSELELVDEIQDEYINSYNISFDEYSYVYNDSEGSEWAMIFDFFKGAERTYMLFSFSLEDHYETANQIYEGIVDSFTYFE